MHEDADISCFAMMIEKRFDLDIASDRLIKSFACCKPPVKSIKALGTQGIDWDVYEKNHSMPSTVQLHL